MTTEKVIQVVPDFKLVAVDETEYYSLPEKFSCVNKVYGVYLVDFNSHTYCCEMTASYWLEHLYNSFDAPDDISDILREEIDQWLSEGDDNSFYAHVRNVEGGGRFQIITSYKFHPDTVGCYFDGDSSYEELTEEVREYYQGNCYF